MYIFTFYIILKFYYYFYLFLSYQKIEFTMYSYFHTILFTYRNDVVLVLVDEYTLWGAWKA